MAMIKRQAENVRTGDRVVRRDERGPYDVAEVHHLSEGQVLIIGRDGGRHLYHSWDLLEVEARSAEEVFARLQTWDAAIARETFDAIVRALSRDRDLVEDVIRLAWAEAENHAEEAKKPD